MKIAVFGPNRRVGVVVGDDVVDVNGAYAKYLTERTDSVRPAARAAHEVPAELNSFIEQGDDALAGATRRSTSCRRTATRRASTANSSCSP